MKVVCYGNMLGTIVGRWKDTRFFHVMIVAGPTDNGQTFPWHGPIAGMHLRPLVR